MESGADDDGDSFDDDEYDAVAEDVNVIDNDIDDNDRPLSNSSASSNDDYNINYSNYSPLLNFR